jgi:hypothetical protein
MRIPRIARARADLGDLRCADNLRCAPPAGPLVDVPFHNELRLFIGEGPLFDDIDIGSSTTENLLLSRRPDLALGLIQATLPARAPCKFLDAIGRSHSGNASHDGNDSHSILSSASQSRMPRGHSLSGTFIAVGRAFHERVRANCVTLTDQGMNIFLFPVARPPDGSGEGQGGY